MGVLQAICSVVTPLELDKSAIDIVTARTWTLLRSKPEGGDPAAASVAPPPPPARPEGLLTVEEIDCYWMANAKGVDHALHYAKMWSKVVAGLVGYSDTAYNDKLDIVTLWTVPYLRI